VSIEEPLSELRTLDIRLSVEGERLRCSAPQVGLACELEQQITALKPELLRSLHPSFGSSLRIPKRPVPQAGAPLSFAQERFWFLQNFDPDTSTYNITASRKFSERLDADRLRAALGTVVERHAVLRTNFSEFDGCPVQVIRATSLVALETHDLEHLSAPAGKETADSIVTALSARPFDLAGEPLLRAALLREADRDRLVVCVHRIISDPWSIGILFAELQYFYAGYSRNESVLPGSLPIQYTDYAFWERERLSSDALNKQIEYWEDKLKGAPPFFDLPLDFERPVSGSYEARVERFELDAFTSEAVKSLARQEGATPFTALLTIFQVLLFRYSNHRDILVGTPVSTRTVPELEQLIGSFINPLVLRTEIPEGITARTLLARVRTTVLESLQNADLPFESLLGKVATARDTARSPLFQVAFILQNTPKTSEYEVHSGGTNLDMTLHMWEANGVFAGYFEYNAKLFAPETIAYFSGCFQTLAAEMAAQPNTAIERLPVVSAAQEGAWFKQYLGPAVPIPDVCTHEWVEQQAAETPERVAVVCGQEQLTFRQLSENSSRLAHRMRGMGVGRGDLVAICLELSVHVPVATLAVWKAGAAYIPLDPQFPRQRISFMLDDARPKAVVTESSLLDALPPHLPNVVSLDRDRSLHQHEGATASFPSVSPHDVAYVIYTSGSTGQPKGVEITHRSLVNFLSSMQREPGIGPSDRLLAVTTLSFDIAGLELYLPLVSGAQVVIAPRTATVDGNALGLLLREADVTIMQATPATWRLLLEAGWQGMPGLKVLCGGEALSRELAEQLLATGAAVWNMYGPTETTIWSTLAPVRSQPGSVPIGRPIANTQVAVLNEAGCVMPPGVVGQLYISGDGLARGYLGREQLTTERFVNDPRHPGERLYQTGDLARWLPDGNLECLGRVDHQIKLRGFRIEVGEIEAALEQQPGISQAAVVAREDESGDRRLTAYFTAHEGDPQRFDILRKSLLRMLPEYMVPSAFVQVEQFPLTPNLKVDRRALLQPEYRPYRSDQHPYGNEVDRHEQDDPNPRRVGYLAPRNHVELVMTEIWGELLGVEKIGVLENFFEVGGHSLTAARLIARLRSALGVNLPLRSIFIDPTIAGLASHIAYNAVNHVYRYTSEIPVWNCLVPAQPSGSRTPLFFVAGYHNPDDTLLVLSQLIPKLGVDQPVFGFRPRWIEGSNNEDYESVGEMAREFLVELRAVQPKGPYLLGGHCVGGIAALEVAQLLLEQGEEVKLMIFLDTERPSPWRIFLTDLFYMRIRMQHIFEIASEILLPRHRRRKDTIRDLARRKLGIAASEEVRETNRFYQAKVRYRRLLYSHTPAPYSGRITLVVNEKQARYDKDLGWSPNSVERLDIHVLPGDHTTLLSDYSDEIAQVMRRSIDQAFGEQKGRQYPVEVTAT
jgi:amino acid adenylation domain-containing protein